MAEKGAKHKRITIKVGDKTYPCYTTMGAAVGFRQQTGRDIEKIEGTSDVAAFVYNCAKSACRREHIDFDMSFEEFCDGVLIEDLNNLQSENSVGVTDAKKKS